MKGSISTTLLVCILVLATGLMFWITGCTLAEPPVRPRPIPTVAPASPKPSIFPRAVLDFRGVGADKVGSGFQPTPNGEPDGHFTVEVDTGGEEAEIVGMRLYTSDRRGSPVFSTQAGQTWSTTGQGWILGVERDGRRLNPSDRRLEDRVKDQARYEIYANGPRWFKAGQHFTLLVHFSDGTTKIASTAPTGTEPSEVQVTQPTSVPTVSEASPLKVEGPASIPTTAIGRGRPEVTINYPEDRAKIASETVTLAGIVTAPNGIARVSITVNGTEIPAPRGITVTPTATKTIPMSIPIPLQPGENVIVLTVFDESGEASQAVRTIYRERVTAGSQIQQAATPMPGVSTERWAVVIGIDHYRDPLIAQLQYAVADAKAFYDFLINNGGVKSSHARLLLNKDATQVNIRRVLGDFLKQKALKEDEVIIYYAGHGTTEPEPGAEGGLAKYLVPWDADPTSLFATGIPMEEIDHIFSRLAARKILLVQDTCFSGGAGGRTFLRRGSTRAPTLTDKFLQDLAHREGRMILTASDANQLSVESQEVGHGLFTYYLLQGLEGAADLDSDGAITIREMHLYLQRKVHERSGGNQTPQLYSIGDMVLVRMK